MHMHMHLHLHIRFRHPAQRNVTAHTYAEGRALAHFVLSVVAAAALIVVTLVVIIHSGGLVVAMKRGNVRGGRCMYYLMRLETISLDNTMVAATACRSVDFPNPFSGVRLAAAPRPP